MISSNKRNFFNTKNTHLRYCHRQYVKRWKGPFNLRHKMKCLNMVVNIQCKYLNNCFSKSLTFCVIKSENNTTTTTTTTKITSIVIGILCGTKKCYTTLNEIDCNNNKNHHKTNFSNWYINWKKYWCCCFSYTNASK